MVSLSSVFALTKLYIPSELVAGCVLGPAQHQCCLANHDWGHTLCMVVLWLYGHNTPSQFDKH